MKTLAICGINKAVVRHCRPAADVLKAGSDEETVGWINEHLAKHGGTTSGLYVLTVSRETARRQARPCAGDAVLACPLSRLTMLEASLTRLLRPVSRNVHAQAKAHVVITCLR